MKLKKIVENIGKMPSTLKGFNDNPKLSKEEKQKLLNMVSGYNQLGEKLRMENSLIETASSLAEISKLAETYACSESQDWFATEVVKNDFKRAKGISETFQKLAKECHSKVQQLNALYEDMGHILQRYYEIADPVTAEVVTNTTDIKSQRPLPNANPGNVQEVSHNDKNIKSQRSLPSGGPATAQVKEVTHNDSNLQSQRELPHVNGPATSQVKEVTHNDKNIKSQRSLPSGGPAPAQVKEVAVDGLNKNIKGQRDLPSGGPTSYNPPKDPKDTGSVKESTDDQPKSQTGTHGWEGNRAWNYDHKLGKRVWSQNIKTGKIPENPNVNKSQSSVNEVDHNEDDLQSQRDLPQGGPESYTYEKVESPSVPVKPAGPGESNVKGDRDVPQGGPSKDNVYKNSGPDNTTKLPSLSEILRMK